MSEHTSKLYRSKTDRIIAGVCGGLASYFEVDPTVVRIIFVLLGFMNGLGLLLYILLLVVMPENKTEVLEHPVDRGDKAKEFVEELRVGTERVAAEIKQNMSERKERSHGGRNFFGTLLILIGLLFLLQQVFPGFHVRWNFVWPILIVLLGLYILGRKKD